MLPVAHLAVAHPACYMPVDDDPTYDAAMNELIAIRSAIEGGRTAAGLDAAELALLEESAEGEVRSLRCVCLLVRQY